MNMYSGRQLKCDDDEDLEEVKNKTMLSQTKIELTQKKKLFLNLGQKLPDGGAKLKRDIEKLEMKLKDLELTVQSEKSDKENSDEESHSGICLKEDCGGAKNSKLSNASIDSLCCNINSISISKGKSLGERSIGSAQRDADSTRSFAAKILEGQKSKTSGDVDCELSGTVDNNDNHSRVVRQSMNDPNHTSGILSSKKANLPGNLVLSQKKDIHGGKDDRSVIPKSRNVFTNSNNLDNLSGDNSSNGARVLSQKKDVHGGKDDRSAIPKSQNVFTNSNNSDHLSGDNSSHRTKDMKFRSSVNITLKTEEDSGVPKQNKSKTEPNVIGLNSFSAVQNIGEKAERSCSISANQSLTFSDLRKEHESQAPEVAQVSDVKHGSWKNWRDQSVRHVKLTEAQPLASDPRVYVPKKTWLGTSCALPKSRVTTEEVAKMHELLKACPSEQDEEKDPAGLKTKLMVHQKRALAWLMWREKQTPSGGIFADDMGLGKTLTMLSLILKQNNSLGNDHSVVAEGSIPSKATLIVCLASVMHQWKTEVQKHCHSETLNVLIYHSKKNREANLKNIDDYDIVVTTYGIINSEGKSLISGSHIVPLLFQIHWERIILDEAHTIKNEKCSTSKCIYLLQASCRWAVTGTPIHNDVKDLYSLLKFLRYSPFDDYKVWKNFVGDHSPKCIERRNTLIKGILFRRTKEQCDESGKRLVQLPKKTVVKHKLKLSEVERKVYTLLYDKSRTRVKNYLEAKDQRSESSCNAGSADQNYLVALLRLQQCCNHVSLLKGAVEDEVSLNESVISEIADDMASLSIESKNSKELLDFSFNLDVAEDNFSISFPSTKIKALFKELKKIEEVDESQKSVIVSQWVAMLEIVEHHLKECGMKYNIIRGNTKPEDRAKVSTDFNENLKGPKIMLLSLKAGGVGLNLIGGNHLFILDHHWNPALESQACDRIYRVGQLRDVYVHKFLCSDTIEITIAHFQEQKSSDARIALEGGRNVAKKLSFEDLKLLFGIN